MKIASIKSPYCSVFHDQMNFNCSLKPLKSLSIVFSLCAVLSACQKPEPEMAVETKEAPKSEKVQPDLTLICENLKKEMLAMNAQRTALAIEQVNQDIRLCLPLMAWDEQKELIDLSNQMYKQFLKIERTATQQLAFESYALGKSDYPTIQQNHFEQLNIRDQYLIRHQGQAYIELVDQGPKQIFYRRNPQYLAKVFAPYLPEAERVFIEHLAEQNGQLLLQNQKLNITPNEIVQRAIFWESYIQSYPKSHYLKDAQYLAQTYQALLFKGLETSPVSEQYIDASDISASVWLEIEALSQQNDSTLAKQAHKFVEYINMTPVQRLEKIVLPASQYNQVKNDPHQLAVAQLNQFLNLKNVSLTPKSRDCFNDSICMSPNN